MVLGLRENKKKRKNERNDVRIWTFPDDYLDRVKATIISRRDPDRGQPPPDP